ncbi:hypothetical protein EYF80_025203 [Liparis tanakae]|uniref:Uncharacterized protein n=1 Tax=Liparis tanakae TaxID=230148 RepID=A0A4Z2HFS9_9TELE|nr:hypothetical protein EYF80_025203 [Liparis tanakae]
MLRSPMKRPWSSGKAVRLEETKQGKDTERVRLKVPGGDGPGISHHGDGAAAEADGAGCSLWDCEPLEPQIHVDVTELGGKRGGKSERRSRRKSREERRRGGEEEETDCRARNSDEDFTAVLPWAPHSL